jgi:hypothetical protein
MRCIFIFIAILVFTSIPLSDAKLNHQYGKITSIEKYGTSDMCKTTFVFYDNQGYIYHGVADSIECDIVDIDSCFILISTNIDPFSIIKKIHYTPMFIYCMD